MRLTPIQREAVKPSACKLPYLLALIFLAAAAVASQSYAISYGVNLLVNGDAEQGPYSSTGAPITNIPGWMITDAGFSVINYGAPGGYPTTSQGPSAPGGILTGGNQFFAGGNVAVSSITQFIDISQNATDIDAGNVTVDISGYLGGYATDDDNATIYLGFRNGSAVTGTTVQVGPVTAAQRRNMTSLIKSGISAKVPANTRQLEVNLVMTRAQGTANDGSADNLSVSLRRAYVVTSTADSGPGTLREAVAIGNPITFDPTIFSTPQTITLEDYLQITQDTTIQGPGANLLSILFASGTDAEISINGNDLLVPTVTISDLTVAGMDSYNATSNLTNLTCGSLAVDGDSFYPERVVTATNCTFSNSSFEGVQVSFATAIFKNCTMTNNRGNGAYLDIGHMTLNSCNISSNGRDGVLGLGLDSSDTSFIIINNCTISANNGFSEVEADQYTTIFLDSCTIALNRTRGLVADQRSGPSSAVYFRNTIALGDDFDDITFVALGGGTIFSQGFNLTDGGGNGYLTNTGDRLHTDPMLGPLQDNGGPTFTMALLPGSLAIDKGDTPLPTDQRGAPRPIDDPSSANAGGNNADIGAYEYQGPSQLLNLSTRKQVGLGDNVLIGGFIVAGTDAKEVIVRGIGPSLPISGQLADPILELHDSSGTLLAMNDNWKDTQQIDVTNTGIPPSNDLESAIVYNLPAQPLANGGAAYTAILAGNNQSTGIGLLEVYDLGQTANSKLVNISTRGFVGTGDDVLIGGFIPGPRTSGSVQVLVRALGPSLASQGVANVLADPTLELHDGNGNTVATNDNWKDTQQTAIQNTGIPPTDDHESAILATLDASNSGYTAIVRGVNDTTGVGLVEFYALD